jgi:drug/metabolite transporter (DMT)-like permease
MELVADILAKFWGDKGGWYFWSGAIGAYILANIFWLNSLRNGGDLGRGALLFSVASAVGAIAVGVVIFKEKMTHIQLIGACLGIVALMCLTAEGE